MEKHRSKGFSHLAMYLLPLKLGLYYLSHEETIIRSSILILPSSTTLITELTNQYHS